MPCSFTSLLTHSFYHIRDTLELDISTQELRVTVHCDGKEKLLVLKMRSLDALLAQCKNKFNLKSNKSKKSAKALHDCHGALLTNNMLRSLANDQHVYFR